MGSLFPVPLGGSNTAKPKPYWKGQYYPLGALLNFTLPNFTKINIKKNNFIQKDN